MDQLKISNFILFVTIRKSYIIPVFINKPLHAGNCFYQLRFFNFNGFPRASEKYFAQFLLNCGQVDDQILTLIDRAWGLYCEISDRGFLVWTERRRSEVHAKNRGLIFHSTDQTSEVNNRFVIWLNWVCEHMLFARLNRLSSVSLGNIIR
jgi:hypothetical protein